MHRSVREVSSLSMRLGRYAAMLGALPVVLSSMKELRDIAAALDRSEADRDIERGRMRLAHSHPRYAA